MVLTISADLPFAMGRFCTAEGLANVVPLSTMRGAEFKNAYGVDIKTGPLAGVAARAVVVLDEQQRCEVQRTRARDQAEPNYDAALAALK